MSLKDDLRKELDDPEFARFFGEAGAKSSLAFTLNEARTRANLTQKELADKLGVSQEYIARLESGEANPTIGRIGALLAVLGFSLTTGITPLAPESNRAYEYQARSEQAGVVRESKRRKK